MLQWRRGDIPICNDPQRRYYQGVSCIRYHFRQLHVARTLLRTRIILLYRHLLTDNGSLVVPHVASTLHVAHALDRRKASYRYGS